MLSPKIQFQLWCVNFATMLSFCHGLFDTSVVVVVAVIFLFLFCLFCGKISVRMRTYSNWLLCYFCCWLSKRLMYIPFGWYCKCFVYNILCNIDIDICCIQSQSASNQMEWFTGFVMGIVWSIVSNDMIEFTVPYVFWGMTKVLLHRSLSRKIY